MDNNRNNIETWLNENNYSFTTINEPEEFFHFIVKDVGIVKIPIEIYQKRNSPTISIGSMGIMTDSLMEVYTKLTNRERENFIKKIMELLDQLKIPKNIRHNERSFQIAIIVQIPFSSLNKNTLIKTIESVRNACEKSLGLGTKILQEHRKHQ